MLFLPHLKPDRSLAVPHDFDVEGLPGGVTESGEQRLQNLDQTSLFWIAVHYDVQDTGSNDLEEKPRNDSNHILDSWLVKYFAFSHKF